MVGGVNMLEKVDELKKRSEDIKREQVRGCVCVWAAAMWAAAMTTPTCAHRLPRWTHASGMRMRQLSMRALMHACMRVGMYSLFRSVCAGKGPYGP